MADARGEKSKKPPALAKVDTIIFHIYMDIDSDAGYPPQKLFEWIKGTNDDGPPDGSQEDHWEGHGINLELKTNRSSGAADFKKSLQRKGAIVVYLGHSVLDKHHDYHSIGLTPGGKTNEIPSSELRALLKKSQASMVIIASCDSMTSVGAISTGPAVIVTDSGPDRVTWSTHWAFALGAFFFLLVGLELDSGEQPTIRRKSGPASINEALAASASAFDKRKTNDRFVLVHGDGSVKIFP